MYMYSFVLIVLLSLGSTALLMPRIHRTTGRITTHPVSATDETEDSGADFSSSELRELNALVSFL